MLTARLLIFLSLGGVWLAGVSQAQEKFSTGKVPWEVLEKKTIALPQLGLASVLDIDPKLLAPDPEIQDRPSVMDVSTRTYSADISLRLTEFEEDGHSAFDINRHLKFFPSEAQGLRVVDMIKRRSRQGTLPAIIRYRTQFAPGSGIKATQISNPTGDKGSLALLLVPPKADQPVTILLMGGMDDEWTRQIDAGEDYVEWSYTGPLAMGQEFMLSHTVAFCENAEAKTVAAALEKMVDPQGMPANAALSPSILRQLINYPVVVKKLEGKAPGSASGGVKLVWLDHVLEQLDLERPEDMDLLQLAGGESMPGVFHGTAMKIGDQELKQEEMAAVLGGQGTRQSRVFMRDGRVLRGRLEWQSARFESESLGGITLKADSPGRIVLRRGKGDGVMLAKPAAWTADSRDGQVLPVMELPESPLNLRWLGGVKPVPWQEVVAVCALPAPALESEVVLKDGSRWRGWMGGDATAGMSGGYWARDMTALMNLLEGVPLEPAVFTQPFLSLQDGSVIVGEVVAGKLGWHQQADDMEIRITDVAAVKRLPGRDDDAAPVFELSLKNGTKLTGHPHDGVFMWRHGAETLRLSWAWIQHIQISPQEAAKKS